MHTNHQHGYFQEITIVNGVKYAVGMRVLTGNITLAAGAQAIQTFDAGASSRDVTLPTAASESGKEYTFANVGAANNIVIKNSGGTTLYTLAPGQSIRLFNNGTTWYAASTGGGVSAVTPGQKLASGETALDGSNPTSVATGLAAVTSFVAMLKKATSPGVATIVLTANITGAAGNVDVYAWKVTATGDATLVASTATESFYWIAAGT